MRNVILGMYELVHKTTYMLEQNNKLTPALD